VPHEIHIGEWQDAALAILLCCKPIGLNYLREIETPISYCDNKCYAEHCVGAVLAIENHAKAS
jgi:hypothetical protein